MIRHGGAALGGVIGVVPAQAEHVARGGEGREADAPASGKASRRATSPSVPWAARPLPRLPRLVGPRLGGLAPLDQLEHGLRKARARAGPRRAGARSAATRRGRGRPRARSPRPVPGSPRAERHQLHGLPLVDDGAAGGRGGGGRGRRGAREGGGRAHQRRRGGGRQEGRGRVERSPLGQGLAGLPGDLLELLGSPKRTSSSTTCTSRTSAGRPPERLHRLGDEDLRRRGPRRHADARRALQPLRPDVVDVLDEIGRAFPRPFDTSTSRLAFELLAAPITRSTSTPPPPS